MNPINIGVTNMENLLNYIILKINVIECLFVLQLSGCLLCLSILYITLCELLKQYVSSKYAHNFVNIREIAKGIYMVYYAHIYILMAVIYVCYLFFIISINLHYNIYIQQSCQGLSFIEGNLKLDYVNNLNGDFNWEYKNQTKTQINSMYMGVEKTAKIVTTPRMVPMILGKTHIDSHLAKSTFIKMPKIPSLYVDLSKYSKLFEIEQLFHDKLTLHEFKKTHPQFVNQQLIYVDTPPFENDESIINIQEQNKNARVDGSGMPDAFFYDKKDGSIIPIQYKYNSGNNFTKFESAKFAVKYNKTTYLMKIMLAHGEKFERMCEIIKAHNSQFDTGIHVQPSSQQYSRVDLNILKEIDQVNSKFMQQQGNQVKHDFYHQCKSKNHSKFNYNRVFTQALNQFEGTYGGKHSIIIPATKPVIIN